MNGSSYSDTSSLSTVSGTDVKEQTIRGMEPRCTASDGWYVIVDQLSMADGDIPGQNARSKLEMAASRL
jgi:hypothetical protein